MRVLNPDKSVGAKYKACLMGESKEVDLSREAEKNEKLEGK